MLRLGIFIGPVIFVLWVFCLIEVITSKDEDVRHLPKVAWLFIVLLFPLVGSIAWLAVGRPQRGPRRLGAYEREASAFPEYDRPGRAAGLTPESDEAFLRHLRERAEEQRRRAEEQRRQREADGAGEAEGA